MWNASDNQHWVGLQGLCWAAGYSTFSLMMFPISLQLWANHEMVLRRRRWVLQNKTHIYISVHTDRQGWKEFYAGTCSQLICLLKLMWERETGRQKQSQHSEVNFDRISCNTWKRRTHKHYRTVLTSLLPCFNRINSYQIQSDPLRRFIWSWAVE